MIKWRFVFGKNTRNWKELNIYEETGNVLLFMDLMGSKQVGYGSCVS
jgi:hypothetical protein